MHSAAIRKKVLCPLTNQKTGKTYWMRIGNAFVNRDGSTNVYLDAYPTNGKLHIRDLDGEEASEPPDHHMGIRTISPATDMDDKC